MLEIGTKVKVVRDSVIAPGADFHNSMVGLSGVIDRYARHISPVHGVGYVIAVHNEKSGGCVTVYGSEIEVI